MAISNKDIAKKIRIPTTLPITMTKQSYLSHAVSDVRREIRRGKSVQAAINAVNARAGVSTRQKRRTPPSVYILCGILALILFTVALIIFPQSPLHVSKTQRQNSMIAPIDRDHFVLLAGVDTRPPVDQGDGDNIDVPGSRADTIAVAYVPHNASTAVLVNIPRDTNVNVNGCRTWDSKTGKYSDEPFGAQNVKINSAYSNGGPECLSKTVSELLGTPVEEYAEVDFTAFSRIVDLLGGIDVNVDAPVVDDVLGIVVPRAGVRHMDGKTALAFSRARMVEGTDKNDMSRIGRQHEVVQAIVDTIRAQGKAKDPLFLGELVGIVSDSTFMSGISKKDAVSLASTIASMPASAIKMSTLPIKGETQSGNVIVLDSDIRAVMDGVKAMGENSASSGGMDTVHAPDLSTVSITVVTRNKYDERINNVKKIMKPLVKNVEFTTDSDIPTGETTIYVNDTNRGAVATMAQVFPGITVTSDPEPFTHATDIILVLGSDSKDVFMNRHTGDISHEVTVPFTFTGKGSQFVPRL